MGLVLLTGRMVFSVLAATSDFARSFKSPVGRAYYRRYRQGATQNATLVV